MWEWRTDKLYWMLFGGRVMYWWVTWALSVISLILRQMSLWWCTAILKCFCNIFYCLQYFFSQLIFFFCSITVSRRNKKVTQFPCKNKWQIAFFSPFFAERRHFSSLLVFFQKKTCMKSKFIVKYSLNVCDYFFEYLIQYWV